ncbi:TPA: ead/Ea22-like family protein, partial [Klebsiella pneumoniae]|nr:ead/Ea22-like family protein [Klebsiella pneumoniae]
KATRGQWIAFTDTASGTFSVHTPDDSRCENIIKWAGFDCQKNAEANAEYIAAANPENIRRLVKYTTELEASHAELRSTMAAIYNSIKEHGGLHAVAVMNAAKRAHEDSAAIAGETN